MRSRVTSTALELVAGVCLVVAASFVHVGLAWFAAAVCLEAKAYELDLSSRPARRKRSA